jgi:alkylhydroperoxidase/carboxymuconolactone decarboxylase family protein YurZ
VPELRVDERLLLMKSPRPPKTYGTFIARFPKLGEAWDKIGEAGSDGPLDERTVRFIKLAIAIGAMREGAVHSSVRKAVAMGISHEELSQVVALAASTLGMPSTVAVFTWVEEAVAPKAKS